MRSRLRLAVGIVLASAVATLAAGCSAHHRPPATAKVCANDQSPRRLENFFGAASFAVGRAPAGAGDAVTYTRRTDGRQWLLKRCGQHYHCHIENVQTSCGQHEETGVCGKPAPDDWVEIHTLYAEIVNTGSCDPEETPGCCQTRAPGDPILVMGYHAKVTADGPPVLPIPRPWGFEKALWSGSTTGTKPPETCKPAAQWSFLLGCDFTVSEQQLDLFHHIEQARRVQTQLSDDFVREPPRP